MRRVREHQRLLVNAGYGPAVGSNDEARSGRPVDGAPPTRWQGRAVARIEDEPLVRGQGRFIANLPLADAAHVVYVRSPIAHGRILAIDTAAARAAVGVLDVVTAADVEPFATSMPPTVSRAVMKAARTPSLPISRNLEPSAKE